jgi:hypothetical protein
MRLDWIWGGFVGEILEELAEGEIIGAAPSPPRVHS